jgi:hypothetical protein
MKPFLSMSLLLDYLLRIRDNATVVLGVLTIERSWDGSSKRQDVMQLEEREEEGKAKEDNKMDWRLKASPEDVVLLDSIHGIQSRNDEGAEMRPLNTPLSSGGRDSGSGRGMTTVNHSSSNNNSMSRKVLAEFSQRFPIELLMTAIYEFSKNRC